VESKLAAREVFLLYYWQPSVFVLQHDFTRIALPQPTDACYANNTGSLRGYGSVNCDFPSQDLIILYTAALDADPLIYGDALSLTRRFTIRGSDQTELLAQMSVDPTLWDTQAHNLSCQWLHANVNRWRVWITNTPLNGNPLRKTWYAVGACGFIIGCGVGIFVVYILSCRRQNPIAFYFPPLLIVSAVAAGIGCFQTAFVSVLEPQNYPTELFFWIQVLPSPIVFSCVLAIGLRFYLLSVFQEKRSVLLRKEQLALSLGLASMKRRHSSMYTLRNATLIFLPSLLVILIARWSIHVRKRLHLSSWQY
jgi:hypothetical protein